MKICAFADIHGNGSAFDAALGGILSEQADINVFLGDLCGYYYDQLEIYYRLLAIPNLIAIRGNHDSLFIDIYNGNEGTRQNYLSRYGKSMEKLLQSDCHELVSWLSTLPDSITWQSSGVCCCHGSPWAPMDGYVYPDTPMEPFATLNSSVFILGNTHYPMSRRIGEKMIINPGSLGQPRHGGWPSYAVIDLPSGKVVFREVRYDMARLHCQIEEAKETKLYLKEVLCRIK
ncbi:MAG: metallophosphoesterase family protein [Smithella sp.]